MLKREIPVGVAIAVIIVVVVIIGAAFYISSQRKQSAPPEEVKQKMQIYKSYRMKGMMKAQPPTSQSAP